jgi:hypothetical protein
MTHNSKELSEKVNSFDLYRQTTTPKILRRLRRADRKADAERWIDDLAESTGVERRAEFRSYAEVVQYPIEGPACGWVHEPSPHDGGASAARGPLDLNSLSPDEVAAIARALLGDENESLSSANELRFGTHGSMSIDLKKGVWKSFETGEPGGGMIALVAREKGLSDADAYNWICNLLGHPLPSLKNSVSKRHGPMKTKTGSPLFRSGALKMVKLARMVSPLKPIGSFDQMATVAG